MPNVDGLMLYAFSPYALHHVNNIYNNVPNRGSRESQMECITGIQTAPQMRHFYHFGHPAYILNNELQKGQKTCIVIHLGQSAQHA